MENLIKYWEKRDQKINRKLTKLKKEYNNISKKDLKKLEDFYSTLEKLNSFFGENWELNAKFKDLKEVIKKDINLIRATTIAKEVVKTEDNFKIILKKDSDYEYNFANFIAFIKTYGYKIDYSKRRYTSNNIEYFFK